MSREEWVRGYLRTPLSYFPYKCTVYTDFSGTVHVEVREFSYSPYCIAKLDWPAHLEDPDLIRPSLDLLVQTVQEYKK